MRLVKFEINDAESALVETLRESNDFYGDTPRLMFMKLVKKTLAAQAPTTPKEPERKQSAAERKQEDILITRAAKEEARREQYRSTGDWPRYLGVYQGNDHWKFPAFILDSNGNPGVTGAWTPPEDYPHFAEVERMKAQAEPTKGVAMPRFEDFGGDVDAFAEALDQVQKSDIEMRQAQIRAEYS